MAPWEDRTALGAQLFPVEIYFSTKEPKPEANMVGEPVQVHMPSIT